MKKSKKRITNEYLAQAIEEIAKTTIATRVELEQLAAMTARKFEEVDERFQGMDNRLETMNEDIGKVRYYMFHLDEHFVSNPRFESFIEKNALFA